ncbi:peptidase M16 [Neisseria sp. HMSC077D05]|uniref:M16 family metallopeptidase n=1 Tax=Neisseria sp. HMSC077D05 TaxID=1715079 RepID=UPI0008A15E83|nr:pitrilysin family protein [Neisseria sp. HMSC077D05]OFN31894.1 peptidase M16 [Neisseria sp. HMSC077D05]
MKSLPLILALALSTTAQAGVDIQRWTTSNGTEVLLVEQHDNPIVDMQVNFKGAGSVFNPEGKSEVAEFTAALLTDGTEKLDEEAFNAAADDIAAQIDSSSGQESSAAVLRSLSRPETLKQAAGLLNQSLTHPRFDPAVFDRRQKEAVTALQQQETTPDYNAGRALTKLAYPDHPYGSGANITTESIRKVNLDDIRAFHRSHYGKDNAIVAIVGDINRKQADRLVKNVLNGLPERSSAAKNVPPVQQQPAQRRDIPFAGEQAQVLLGMPLIKRHDPDYYALVAGNYILGGGGFDSRLMKVLRDRHGYTYGVHSTLEPATEAGMFTIGYSTQKKNTKDSLVQAQAVIKQFIEEGPTEEELAQAKANIIGSFPLRFDSNAKLVKYLSIIGHHNLPNDYLEAYPKAIGKLTVEQVKDAWQRRVKPEDLHIVVVGAE